MSERASKTRERLAGRYAASTTPSFLRYRPGRAVSAFATSAPRASIGSRVTQPGAILAVRLPGIYADVANTKNVIVNTNYADGQLTQATGFTAAFGGSTAHSKTLAPNDKVYVTNINVKRDSVLLELLTVDVTTLADGQGTRYRAELNVKLPGLDTMNSEDVKKTIGMHEPFILS